jgi:tetratricopeptide (TPR) repeat protein
VKLGAERLLAFAEALVAAGQLQTADEAIAVVDTQLAPSQQIQLHLVRSQLFSARGDHEHEKEQLEAALALEPLNGPALLALGRLYKSTNDFTRAEISLETAAQQPKFAYYSCIELADIALKTRRYQRALDLLQRAAKLDSVVNLQPYINQIKRVIDQNENAISKP